MIQMNYILENVDVEDKSIIYQIKKSSIRPYVEKIWGWDEEYQLEDFENSFCLEDVKKIMVEKTLVGFVEILDSEEAINISEIHIIPSYQGLGIGGSIIREILNNAMAMSKPVTLGCFKDNIQAVKLYNRLGFNVVNETETHFCFEFK